MKKKTKRKLRRNVKDLKSDLESIINTTKQKAVQIARDPMKAAVAGGLVSGAGAFLSGGGIYTDSNEMVIGGVCTILSGLAGVAASHYARERRENIKWEESRIPAVTRFSYQRDDSQREDYIARMVDCNDPITMTFEDGRGKFYAQNVLVEDQKNLKRTGKPLKWKELMELPKNTPLYVEIKKDKTYTFHYAGLKKRAAKKDPETYTRLRVMGRTEMIHKSQLRKELKVYLMEDA